MPYKRILHRERFFQINALEGIDRDMHQICFRQLRVFLKITGITFIFLLCIGSLGSQETSLFLLEETCEKSTRPINSINSCTRACCASNLFNPTRPGFLNNRASDIVGVSPLAAPGIIIPEGLTGEGQIIGLADSGLDIGSMSDIHPDLQSQPGHMPKIVMLKSWAGREIPDDPLGHGTHMAATVAGTGAASEGKYQGIAPGASIYFQALLDGGEKLEPPNNLTDLFYPAYAAGVRVHINGWGGGENIYSSSTAQIDAFVRRYPDFLPLFAAGNRGPNNKSLTSGANSKNALVVGASQNVRPALSPEAVDASQIASFSSRGPAGDGRIKPDLVAAGSAMISACSRLVESNFEPNPLYTRMEGTSMSAAVAGGATALLREWFQKQERIKEPSAALLKAVLINGARLPKEGPSYDKGFGILDLSNSILALQNKSFQYVDARKGVKEGEVSEYRFKVEEEKKGQPVKVTLVWTDPAAPSRANPALINNLDLQVVDSQGKTYWGNHLLHNNQPDELNNVEQVYIPEAASGEYFIKVLGRNIKESAATPVEDLNDEDSPAQDFALVYGQIVDRGIVQKVSPQGQLLLGAEEPSVVELKTEKIQPVVDGKKIKDSNPSPSRGGETERIPLGSELYQTSPEVYVFGSIWQASGVQVLPTEKGPLFMEIDTSEREGGFFLDPRASSVKVNGSEVRQLDKIPAGVEVQASLNPFTQTLWQVIVGYQEKQGVIYKIDREKKQIWLLKESQPYQLSEKAVVSITDRVVDAGVMDTAYGSGEVSSLEKVFPGVAVRLVLSPTTQEVQYLAVQRELALGKLTSIDRENRLISLESGNQYEVMEGAQVIRDEKSVDFLKLQPGDYVMAVVIQEANQIIHLTANSTVVFGRLMYLSEKNGLLYLVDNQNRFNIYHLTPNTKIYRWGLPVEPTSLKTGGWVRLFIRPGSDEVWRLDAAELAREETRTIASYDHKEKRLYFTNNTSCLLNPEILITKNGYLMEPQDLAKGEPARLSFLQSKTSDAEVLTAIEVNNEKPEPHLNVLALKQENVIRITGNTSADHLYLYRQDGQREKIPVSGAGYYVWYFDAQPQESVVQVVGVDTHSGGLVGYRIELNQIGKFGFSDIEGHWAARCIADLARRCVLIGYPDGTFRPERPITRAEMACLLNHLVVWSGDFRVRAQSYTDTEEIPWWARQEATAVQAQGLMIGYPDGSFKPNRMVTRGELAVIVKRLLEKFVQLAEGMEISTIDLLEESSDNGSLLLIINEQLDRAEENKAVDTDKLEETNSNEQINALQTNSSKVSNEDFLSDLDSLPDWCRTAVKEAAALQIIQGRGTEGFCAGAPATRAEAAAVSYRALAWLDRLEQWE